MAKAVSGLANNDIWSSRKLPSKSETSPVFSINSRVNKRGFFPLFSAFSLSFARLKTLSRKICSQVSSISGLSGLSFLRRFSAKPSSTWMSLTLHEPLIAAMALVRFIFSIRILLDRKFGMCFSNSATFEKYSSRTMNINLQSMSDSTRTFKTCTRLCFSSFVPKMNNSSNWSKTNIKCLWKSSEISLRAFLNRRAVSNWWGIDSFSRIWIASERLSRMLSERRI